MSIREPNVRFRTPAHPLDSSPRGTLWHILAHFSVQPEIAEWVNLNSTEEARDDLPIAERLMNIFLDMLKFQDIQLAPSEQPQAGIWELSKDAFHGELYRLAATRDVVGLARYMRNAMRETLTHGLGPGCQVFQSMEAGGAGLEANVLIILDRLASLAEALSVINYENPEQGCYGENIALSATKLVSNIERHLGYQIGRPPVMGAFGIDVDGQIIDARVPDDVYSAERIKMVTGVFGLRHVAEIGAGLGGCAIQAIRAGINSYTVFDLPAILVVQGWLLMKVFGGDIISMFGEPDKDRKIKLRPYWEFYDRTNHFDLVFNRDSLPEIPQQHAAAYVKEIAQRGCGFLSINQESQGNTGTPGVQQLWVNRLVAKEPSLRCVGRHPYWTRKGYVEELFLPVGLGTCRATSQNPSLTLPP